MKCIQIRKEDIKLSLFANDMVVYVVNPMESINKQTNIQTKTTQLLEQISEFSKVAIYKINIQKLYTFVFLDIQLYMQLLFLYINE